MRRIRLITSLMLVTSIVSCGSIPVPEFAANQKITGISAVAIKNSLAELHKKAEPVQGSQNMKTVSFITQSAVPGVVQKRIVENKLQTRHGKQENSQHAGREGSTEKLQADPYTNVRTHASATSSQSIKTGVNVHEQQSTETPEYTDAQDAINSGKYPDAISLLEILVRENRKNIRYKTLLVQAYMRYGQQLEGSGDLEKAGIYYTKAASMDPQHDKASVAARVVANKIESKNAYSKGIEAVKNGQVDEAIGLFRRSLDIEPDNIRAIKQIELLKKNHLNNYYTQAMTLFRSQQLVKSIAAWDKVLMLEPDHKMAQHYRVKAIDLKAKLDKL